MHEKQNFESFTSTWYVTRHSVIHFLKIQPEIATILVTDFFICAQIKYYEKKIICIITGVLGCTDANGLATLNAPLPVRSAKLRNVGSG